MNRVLKEKIKKDIFRFYGEDKIPIKKRMFEDKELKYIITLRKTQFYKLNKRRILYIVNSIILKKMQRKYFIQIPANVEIGEGFYIGHLGRIIINPTAKIGKNVNIATGVTIGQENRGKRKGTPIIGDRVWIGTNAVIVGKIKIEPNVLIAPNAYVNFDVPSDSIVIGNPAKIIHKEGACDSYIENVII